MEKRIITVSREFGSGGRSVGKALAKRLGWKYYDKELVKAVAEKTGFDPRFIEERGEFSVGKSLLSYALAGQGMPGVMNGMSASDFLWCMQREVILKLAEEGGCVIVGRCADYILRERKDVFNVFVHAPMAYRADRLVRRYGESERSRPFVDCLAQSSSMALTGQSSAAWRTWASCSGKISSRAAATPSSVMVKMPGQTPVHSPQPMQASFT